MNRFYFLRKLIRLTLVQISVMYIRNVNAQLQWIFRVKVLNLVLFFYFMTAFSVDDGVMRRNVTELDFKM